MPRPTLTPLTEEEKFKLREQQEQELGRLQRQYNILEKDRQLYSAGIQLTKLNKIVSVFRQEYSNVVTDLEVASAPAKTRQDAKDTDQLSKLLEDHEFYTGEVKKQRKYIEEIEAQIQRVEKNVVKLRSMQITDRQHEDRVWAARKTVEGLMNKLDVQNKKFGNICAKNKALRGEIKRMLWERDIFMKIWDKLINKLVLGKKFMMDLTEQATIAYDQREQWVSKLQALRIKAHHDFVMDTHEMRELKRRQDNGKKLEEFYNTKGMKRVMKDLEEKRRIQRLENKFAMKEQLKQYKKYIENIWEFTNERKIDEIARKFHLQESENFSLFERVNNLVQELENLGDKFGHSQEEIMAEKELEQERSEKRQATLKNMEEEVEVATKKLQNTKEELDFIENYTQQMCSGIEQLFQICRCDRDPILKLLGDNKNINVYNAMFYIKMVEEQILEAMAVVYQDEKIAYERKKITGGQRIVWDDTTKGEVPSLEKFVPTNPCPLCVTNNMVSDVIDNIQHALTREEAKKQLQERLHMKEYGDYLHNVSKCFLPESREIVQKRYQ